jgi:hypothetical protein
MTAIVLGFMVAVPCGLFAMVLWWWFTEGDDR